ncbi:cytochrome c maturation protein CcmE [Schinkia azotoformans]|uniref:cytochrome c maturation protein CcmE n=1 Tax=Schinkia azotoformans TaxID=1454 RepID=UPI002DB9FB18|nr:cytochrome c maturation protein CcmE [Schinkia azotoformans]MEC1742798.1 cytochrome c maturation protein CcmE [Schinkia azotoformans]MEC1769029.1 cytochrome c maturation protein CcmE [Schinkia azotoformans]MEC1789614.1 cytochrome c maturation protein CcmE [Schinkia azotoformans]MED4378439.1 cytochrome c maturation protein CcmE [Schinkia azotoformans]MED4417418.1 cytochrome c maturation protein CcmE [Schinkia azotoformans]
MSIKVKVGAAIFLIIIVIGTLSVFGMSQASTFYLTVDEYFEQKDDLNGKPFKLSGKIVGSSVQYDQQNLELRFEAKGESGKTVQISYKGVQPDNFIDDWEVIIEGMENEEGVIEASELLIKCPSKYEAAADGSTERTYESYENQ